MATAGNLVVLHLWTCDPWYIILQSTVGMSKLLKSNFWLSQIIFQVPSVTLLYLYNLTLVKPNWTCALLIVHLYNTITILRTVPSYIFLCIFPLKPKCENLLNTNYWRWPNMHVSHYLLIANCTSNWELIGQIKHETDCLLVDCSFTNRT